MSVKKQIIEEINELSLQYSRCFITYENYKHRRYELLVKLERLDSTVASDGSIIKDMVSTFSDLIKRS